MQRQKILIVDDEPSIVTALGFLFEQGGYEVMVAHNGEEALQQFERFEPDLVLLDVMMPRMSGYDVCKRLRERPERNHVKVVFLSAKGGEAEISKGLSAGADLFVTKPFSTTELATMVAQLLPASA